MIKFGSDRIRKASGIIAKTGFWARHRGRVDVYELLGSGHRLTIVAVTCSLFGLLAESATLSVERGGQLAGLSRDDTCSKSSSQESERSGDRGGPPRALVASRLVESENASQIVVHSSKSSLLARRLTHASRIFGASTSAAFSRVLFLKLLETALAWLELSVYVVAVVGIMPFLF